MLQNYNGGHLVDDSSGVPGGAAGCVERLLRGDGRQPLIDEAHSDRGIVAGEAIGEFARVIGRGRVVPAEGERQSHDDLTRVKFDCASDDGSNIAVAAPESLDGKSEHSMDIASRNPDPYFAHIDADPGSRAHRLTLQKCRYGIERGGNGRHVRATTLREVVLAAATPTERGRGRPS